MNQKAINDGGCAYPITMDFPGPSTNPLTGKPISNGHTDRHIDLGITKRDYFAGLAMQSYAYQHGNWSFELIANAAYDMADAMIRAREA